MLYLFSVLDRYMADTRVKRQNPTITFKMHELYNELIKDLLHVPGSQSHYLELGEHAEKGTFVKVKHNHTLPYKPTVCISGSVPAFEKKICRSRSAGF